MNGLAFMDSLLSGMTKEALFGRKKVDPVEKLRTAAEKHRADFMSHAGETGGLKAEILGHNKEIGDWERQLRSGNGDTAAIQARLTELKGVRDAKHAKFKGMYGTHEKSWTEYATKSNQPHLMEDMARNKRLVDRAQHIGTSEGRGPLMKIMSRAGEIASKHAKPLAIGTAAVGAGLYAASKIRKAKQGQPANPEAYQEIGQPPMVM